MHLKASIACLAASAVALGAYVAGAQAAPLPTGPIVIVSPYGGGGSTDFALRTISRKVEETSGLSIVIESKPGGAGAIAASAVKRASPDGGMLLLADVGTFGSNVWLFDKLSYDPIKDYKPVTLLWSVANVLVVPANLPVSSLAELVALAKSRPSGISFASQGVGASGHLLGAQLAKLSGAPMTHVPYRGAANALTDLVSGRVDAFFTSYASARSNIESGQLKILAITSDKRDPLIPNVPTVAEAGFPDLTMDIWFGLVAPAQTPDAVVNELQGKFATAVNAIDVKAKLSEQALYATANTPEQFKALIASEIERYKSIVAASGAKIN